MMDAKEFVKALQRICAAHHAKREGDPVFIECKGCPVYDCCKGYCPKHWEHIDDFANKVEQWAKEHPRKTRLEDLKEKYPNVPFGQDGLPSFMPRSLGYCPADNCFDCPYKEQNTKKCWDMEVEEK